MNLRSVHAVLILLSAALAVLFGVWCLGEYRRWRRGNPAGRCRGLRGVVRPGRLRLLVPAQDENAAMTPRSALPARRPSRLRTCAATARLACTALAVLIGGGSSLLACPLCFGAEETSLVQGTQLGVLMMLAVLLAVQGGFVGFFLYLRKRAKRIAAVELDAEWSKLQRSPRTS
jgi:hypothetical protein